MAFADVTDGSRAILEGSGASKVALSGTVQVGDAIGLSGSTWVRADGNNKVTGQLVAGRDGISGDVITAYRQAVVGGVSGGTKGAPIYLSDTAGGYSETPSTTTRQVLGFGLTATEMYIAPQEFNTEYLNPNEQFELVAVSKTLDIGDCGVAQVVTVDALVITLPSTVVGYSYTIINGAADGAVLVAVSPAAIDMIVGNGFTGADNKDALNTKVTAKRGDFIKIVGDGVNGWMVTSVRGTWAREA